MPSAPRSLQITDSRVLAAMAHPLRQRLLDVLQVDGPATVSELAEKTGQAVGNVSHHLRVLGAAGLIEEAPELARDRRERWWRRTSDSLRWSRRDFKDDPAAEVIETAAASLSFDHHVNQIRAWIASDEGERAAWQHGPFMTDQWLRLTDGELAELAGEVIALLRRWSDRPLPEDRQERHTVFAFAAGVPGRP